MEGVNSGTWRGLAKKKGGGRFRNREGLVQEQGEVGSGVGGGRFRNRERSIQE